jgi:hypothetical protein
MIHYTTRSAYSATSWARVRAFLVATSFVLRAIRADYAFGSAGRGATKVSSYAGANRLVVYNAALAVRPTG